MEWKRNHQNFTSTSANSVFRSGVNKPGRARLASETKEEREQRLEHENVVSKVFGLNKQVRKHRSDSKLNDSEMPADVSVKHPNK